MVKNINIPLDDEEFDELSDDKKAKGCTSWKTYFLAFIKNKDNKQ